MQPELGRRVNLVLFFVQEARHSRDQNSVGAQSRGQSCSRRGEDVEEKQDARLDTPNAEGGNMHSRSILSMCSRIAAVGHVCHHTLFHKSQPRSFDLACWGIGIFCTSTAWCSPGGRQLIKFGQSIRQLSPIAIPILPPISRISRCMSCCHFSNPFWSKLPTCSPTRFVTLICTCSI